MTSPGQKQRKFTRLVPRLLDYIHEQGYECTFGDAYRDPRLHGEMGVKIGYGHPRSGHKLKIAIDLNLSLNGVYLEGTDAHQKFGEFWESLDPDCRWGGRFADGNHYSLEHEGVK